MRYLSYLSGALLFVAGTLTVCNVWRASESFAATPFSFAPSTDVITSLEKQIHQLTEEFTRLNQQQQQLQNELETHHTQKHEPQQHHEQQQDRTTSSIADRLPQCDEVMQAPNSPFKDGAFITAHTTPIQWTPRADGSRQFDLNNYICRLKRYTAKEAKQCLVSSSSYQHVSFIGDSLTRYQYLSLAYFLEHEAFPPRFGKYRQPCTHFNESGHATCSPLDQPNISMETDWGKNIPKDFGSNDPWIYFFSSLGGGGSGGGGGIMNGRMECSCARSNTMKCTGRSTIGCGTENQLYTTNANKNGQKVVLSYFKEDGWGNTPHPLHGYNFTNCSETGTCHLSLQQSQLLVNRSENFDYDWSQPFPEAISTSGVLRGGGGGGGGIGLPSQPDIVIYNRGHWGRLSTERAKTIMPILYDWVNQDDQDTRSTNKKKENGGGRCFFKSTTGSYAKTITSISKEELVAVRPQVHEAGCEYLDYGHLTKIFAGLGQTKDWGQKGERGAVFWDIVHYMPWVYEELNQVLLNVLCNSIKLSEEEG